MRNKIIKQEKIRIYQLNGLNFNVNSSEKILS